MGSSSKKQGTHTFFGPNIVPKKVWDPKKSMTSKEKRIPYWVFGTMFGPKKSMSSFFFGTHTFSWIPYFFSTQCLARNKYEFLLGNSYSFLDPILFLFGPEKVLYAFLFFGTHTFFGDPILFCDKMFGPQEYDLARRKYELLFFGTHTVLLETHTCFGAMLGPKKYKWCPFFGHVRFFGAVISLMTKMFGFLIGHVFPETDSKYPRC